MLRSRASGILLHPTSLPSSYGIGDFGKEAFRFVDYLVSAKQTRWQILPLGPAGFGDSPYAAYSSFAGNAILISLEKLVEVGDLTAESLRSAPSFSAATVEYETVRGWKMPLLRLAAENFLKHGSPSRKNEFIEFCRDQASWLEDYTLFMALKEHFEAIAAAKGEACNSWSSYWDRDIALRHPDAMQQWHSVLEDEIAIRKVWQYYFFTQWQAVKKYANEQGISIIGDLPIFVAHDSADVWSDPKSFMLNADGEPIFVAGVPPDYFSETGQRWGNPVYNWDAMLKDNFSWWIRRFKGTRELVDIIRVDHFRGFEAFWSIPATEPTAVNGSWVPAPGMELFKQVREQLGNIPILAEDLGLITPEVDQLRDANGFPGMKVLQFAFDTKELRSRLYLPHYHVPNSVVYTGTHDNDTILGWYRLASDAERASVHRYIGQSCGDISWDFIRLAMASVSRLAIIPMQDVLSLGSESRMNTPATILANWAWRLPNDYADSKKSGGTADRLRELTEMYHRVDDELTETQLFL